MRVLITGGGGFVGSHLAEALFRRGDEILVLDDFSTGNRENLRHLEGRRGFELVVGSVDDRRLVHSLVRNADAVVHLAGKPASVAATRIDDVALHNLLGARTVLDEAGRAGRRTVLVVPDTDGAHVVDASGVDDVAARRIYGELGAPVTLVRLQNVVGPRQSPAFAAALPRFVHQAMAGEDVVVPGPDDCDYAFVYVEDVVDGLVRTLDRREAVGRAFTLGSDEAMSLDRIARVVVEQTGSRSTVRRVPSAVPTPRDAVPGIPELAGARRVVGYRPEWRLTDIVRALVSEHLGDPIVAPASVASEPGVQLPDTVPPVPPGADAWAEEEPSGAGGEPDEGAVSVIVPVYNEAPSIVETIRRIRAQPLPMQLIVVDDGSTDGTAEELSRVSHLVDELVVLPHNHGKGSAVRAGLRLARHDVVVFHDADLELDPDEIPKLVEPVRRGVADFVNGNRLHPANRPFIPRIQLFGNLGLRWWARHLHGLPIRDMESAAKVLRRETLEAMKLRSERFEIEPEISAKAAALDVTFLELPISFRPRTRAEGKKLRWRDGFIALWTLFKYRRWDPARDTTPPRPVLAALERHERTEEESGSKPAESDGVAGGSVPAPGGNARGTRDGGRTEEGGGQAPSPRTDSVSAGAAPTASNGGRFGPPPFTPLQPQVVLSPRAEAG